MLVFADAVFFGGLAQLVQGVVGDLQHPARRDDAVGRLEVAVAVQVRLLQVDHAFEQVVNERRDEHVVQFDIIIFQYILHKNES